MKLNTLISALPSLNLQELATLKAAINQLLDDPAPEEPRLYGLIVGLLGSRLPWRVFTNSTSHKAYQRGANAVGAFIERHWANQPDVMKRALERFMLETLLEDLKGRGAVLTVGVICANLDRLPALFSQQFPSYLESGMADVIVQAMRRG